MLLHNDGVLELGEDSRLLQPRTGADAGQLQGENCAIGWKQ